MALRIAEVMLYFYLIHIEAYQTHSFLASPSFYEWDNVVSGTSSFDHCK